MIMKIFLKKIKKVTITALTFCCALYSVSSQNIHEQLNKYNVCWNSQSNNSSESMPLGGGDIGLNVWVENGDILFYIARSGTFDENNELLKLGRCRLRLEPNLFANPDFQFKQELRLYDGDMMIEGKNGDETVRIHLWVDVFSPQVHIEVKSSSEVKLTAFAENWRNTDQLVSAIRRHSCFSYSGFPGELFTYKDSIRFEDNGVLWYHRNREDQLLFDFCVRQQELEPIKDKLSNPQKGLTFGAFFSGEEMKPGKPGTGKYVDTPFSFWSIESEKPQKEHTVTLKLHTAQTQSAEVWEKSIFEIKPTISQEKTKEWWHQFWQRSYVFINSGINNPDNKGWQVGRNYQLLRYMLGCNAYGQYPTKFNGGLFTTDPVFVKQFAAPNHETPDYRSWGGGSHTAQNQRLVYWPMLKSGDFDMMHSQFNFYNRSLKNNELRSRFYWGHEGCSFTEHPETFGLPAASLWGFDKGVRKRKSSTEYGEITNDYVKYHYTNQLEFAFMILKYHQYTGKDIQEYISFINSSVIFFFEHYKYLNKERTGKALDENGKLMLFPSTAAETYKNIANPTDLCAALKAVVLAIIDLPEMYISSNEKAAWKVKLNQIPDLTYGEVKGHRILVPGKNLSAPINQEITELYPVFPYELYGIGLPDIQTAVDTWKYGTFARNYISWHQDGIFCARLGLAEEARKITIQKLEDSIRKFPAFWGPGHDYVPDHNWGGSGMIGLQDMLMQCVGDNIYLLPAWSKDWDVEFKLHALGNTVINCKVKNGKISHLQITPESRMKNLIIAPEFKN